MAFLEALKPKAGSKHLSRIVNAEGKLVEVETRDDEQQRVNYDEIIKLLVEAGYYRVKIKGLSEFDKVVGGMTWCIGFCSIDLDVDLLFQENFTIGQKIALTEKIVAVLPKMKCPHTIEPHQIQGLDFIHINPVIQWLVKRSIESREEIGDLLRQYGVHHFDKAHSLPDEKLDPVFLQNAFSNIKTVQDKYSIQRKYRRVKEENSEDTMSRVQSTLFEYGFTPLDEDEFGDEKDKIQIVDEKQLQKYISSMTATTQDTMLSTGVVSSIVSKKVDDIKEAVSNYSTLQAEMEKSGAAEIKRLKTEEIALLKTKNELEKNLESISERIEQLEQRIRTPSNLDGMAEQEKNVVKQLEIMLLTNECLKDQEIQFRDQCKAELSNLQAMIKEAESENSVFEEEEKIQAKEYGERVMKGRCELGKVTRSLSLIQRKIDEVPSRAELAQYQRRFLELYNQVGAKHRETKQYYTLYNTLNDVHQYLSKEVNILNSILENYNEAMSSAASKDEFMKQFEAIVDGIKQNKMKVEQRRNDERDTRDKYKGQLQSLIEQQRAYSSVLKELSQTCKLNEKLAALVKAASQSPSPLRGIPLT